MNLLISEYPLQVLPSLAQAIGLNEAIVLQQLHYWIVNKNNKGLQQDGYKWVYNSYPKWQETNFPFWSIRTIQRTFLNLEEVGLIVSVQASSTSRNKFYRINYDKLDEIRDAIVPNWHDGTCQNGTVLITETTTDIEGSVDPLRTQSTKSHNHKPIFTALLKATGFDSKIANHRGRLNRAAKQLADAEYTVEDIEAVLSWWKREDFRWQKSRQLPKPEDVITMISQVVKKDEPTEQTGELRKLLEKEGYYD